MSTGLRTRLRQATALLLGAVAAAVMVLLGIWQLDVYHAQGAQTAQQRAAAPPVPLTAVAPPASSVVDGYGRSVTFEGSYLPSLQLLVPVDGQPGTFRVLTALRETDGSVVPVVRGLVTSRSAPAADTTPVSQTGVLLPSEDTADADQPDGQAGSIRVPQLAQQWPAPLVDGYVTLSADDAREQGLAPAPVDLPQAQGRLRNGAYALQWWVFAAFAVAMSIRMARDFGRAGAAEVAEITAEAPGQPT